MSDDLPERSGADRTDPADITLPAMAAVAAAVHGFGPEVLSRAPDADADHEAEIGRHIIQAVDAALGQPGSLRDNIDRLAADPQDHRALVGLHHDVQAAATADPSLLAQVERASQSDDPVAEDSRIPPHSAPAE
jgi:hypothetical protein